MVVWPGVVCPALPNVLVAVEPVPGVVVFAGEKNNKKSHKKNAASKSIPAPTIRILFMRCRFMILLAGAVKLARWWQYS